MAKAMAQVLNGIPGIVYFIDDILVKVISWSRAVPEQHETNLYEVLTRIHEYGLHLNRQMCVFSKRA